MKAKPIITLFFVLHFFASYSFAQKSNLSYLVQESNKKIDNKDYTGALDDCKMALLIYPKNAIVHAQFAVVYYAMGEQKQSEKEIKKSQDLCKDCNEVYFFLLNYTARKRQYKEALAYADQIQKQDTSIIVANRVAFSKGQIYYDQKDFPTGYKFFKDAYNFIPQDMHALSKMITHEAYTNQLDLCNSHLAILAANEDKVTNYLVFREKGVALAKLGRYNEAITAYDRAIKLSSSKSSTNYLNRALAKANLKQIDEANKDIDSAAMYSNAKSKAGINYAKSYVLLIADNYNEAINLCNQSITENATADAYHCRGYAYYKLGGADNWQKAIADYDKAFVLGGKYYTAFWGDYKKLIEQSK